MSRDLPELPMPTAKKERFEPGESTVGSHLAKRMVDLYQRHGAQWHPEEITEDLASIINDTYDGNSFLDDAFFYLNRSSVETQRESTHLLSPLVNILYDLGHNDFILDHSNGVPPEYAGSLLKGTKERPLRAFYLFPEDSPFEETDWVGIHTTDCIIGIQGDIKNTAKHASHSTFYLQSAPRLISNTAEDCTFFLPGAQNLRWERGGMQQKIQYLQHGEKRELLVGNEFFPNGNHLLVPDSEGWKESVPGYFHQLRTTMREKVREEGWDLTEWQ